MQTPSIGVPTNMTQPQPRSDHDQTPSDGSESLFSMYLDRVIEEDRRMVESWKGDAERLLTSVGLQTTSYSSAIT